MEEIRNLGEPIAEFAIALILSGSIFIGAMVFGMIRYFINGKKFWHPYNE